MGEIRVRAAMVGGVRGRLRRLLVAVVAVVGLVALGLPAGAQEQDGGTITATVTVADQVCLLVGAETLDFGVLDFDGSGSSTPYTVESCSTAGQELFASGTDAANEDASVAWTLVAGDGQRAADEFSVDADLAGIGSSWLTPLAATVGVIGPGAQTDAVHELFTPPVGSAGAGETLSFELIWLAVLDES
jgi:hypothetical protein